MWQPMVESDRERVVEEWGPTALRVGIGFAMMVNGAGKLFNWGPRAVGIDVFAGYLASLSVPFPVMFAWLAALAEFGGGLLIFLGLFTRIAAVFTGITMLVAMLLVNLPGGFPTQSVGTAYTIGEYNFVLIAASVALILLGDGRLSLERALFGRELVPKWLGTDSPPNATDVDTQQKRQRPS